MATNNPPSPNSNKRKRGQTESETGRIMRPPSTNGDSAVTDAMYSSLLQGLTDSVPTQDETSRTAQAALQQQQQSAYPEPNVFDHAGVHAGFEDPTAHMQPPVPQHQMSPSGQVTFDARQSQQNKPPVGTPQWHQLRKDNHKEVERRRREVINEGIENLAKMIPHNSDKNKGTILGGACRYITELQSKIAAFDNERHVFDLTQQELTRRNESLRDSAQRAWAETAKWMARCKEHGLQYDDYDTNVEPAEEFQDSTNTNMGGMGAGSDPAVFNVSSDAGDKIDDNPMA